MRSEPVPNQSFIPIRDEDQQPVYLVRVQVTHEPVKLSTKTRRTKSSIEYDILSMITEQSGSVASCFSLPCISPSAAMKNKRFSIINGYVKKEAGVIQKV